MRLSTILPHLASLRVERVQIVAEVLTVRAGARGGGACCPVCGVCSSCVQSRYQRTVADRSVGGRRVVLVLRVRRFVCQNQDRPRRIFAERFPNWPRPTRAVRRRRSGTL